MEVAEDLKQHLGGIGHAKLNPKHERVIMLLGAIAGIIGLFLLLRSHESGSASITTSALTNSAGNTQGIGSSAGAYAGSLPFGTDTAALLSYLQSSGIGTAGGAASVTSSPTTIAPGPATTTAGGVTTAPPATTPPASPAPLVPVNPVVNGTGAAGMYREVASVDPNPYLFEPPAFSAPSLSNLLGGIGAGGTANLNNVGNTTINNNTSTTTINNFTNVGNTDSGNILDSPNSGNNSGTTTAGNITGSGASSLPMFGNPLRFAGGSFLPSIGAGGGVTVPPPIGITPTEPTSSPPAGFPISSGGAANSNANTGLHLLNPGGGGPANKYGPGGSLVRN